MVFGATSCVTARCWAASEPLESKTTNTAKAGTIKVFMSIPRAVGNGICDS